MPSLNAKYLELFELPILTAALKYWDWTNTTRIQADIVSKQQSAS